MFKSIANIPIFRRLFYAFLLAAVVPGLIIIILGFVFTNTINGRSAQLRYATNMIEDSAYIKSEIRLLRDQPDLIRSNLSNGDRLTNFVQNLDAQASEIDRNLSQFKDKYSLEGSPKMKGILDAVTADSADTNIPRVQTQTLDLLTSTTWHQYYAAEQRLDNHDMPTGDKTAILNDLQTLDSKYKELSDRWGFVDVYATEISNIVADPGASLNNTLISATTISFLFTITIIIVIGYVVNRTITDPLRDLANLTKRIARGETNARANIDGRDEIYTVATSMNNMLDNIVRLIQETQSQRDVLQGQVEKLVSEVSGVGEGDLRVQAEVTADALGVLADSFNYMVEELGSLVVRVKMVAGEVEKSANSTLDRMTQLVETGDIQIGQIGEAEAVVEQLASSSRQVASRSQVLLEVANQARTDARAGRNSVYQAIEGMGRINENVQTTASKVQNLGDRSREINEIAEVISSIAHQTNRLALDAAIQAAMAGENGKGFGAVAADIRRLAERSKEQAGFINRLVRSIREDIGAVAVSMQDTQRETAGGAQLTQQAGISLGSIFAAIENQAREIDGINQLAVEQLTSTGSVVNLMHAVSESTHQSNASTRDASENMERLARLVEQLRASVEAFKLRENEGYLTPNSNARLSVDDGNNPGLTMTSTFRTVSSTAMPAYSPNSDNRGFDNGYGGFDQFSPQFPVEAQTNSRGWNAGLPPTSNNPPRLNAPQQNGQPYNSGGDYNGNNNSNGNRGYPQNPQNSNW